MPEARRTAIPAPLTPAPRRAPSTGAIVTLGVSLLAVLGIATVFGGAIAALLSPPATASDGDESR